MTARQRPHLFRWPFSLQAAQESLGYITYEFGHPWSFRTLGAPDIDVTSPFCSLLLRNPLNSFLWFFPIFYLTLSAAIVHDVTFRTPLHVFFFNTTRSTFHFNLKNRSMESLTTVYSWTVLPYSSMCRVVNFKFIGWIKIQIYTLSCCNTWIYTHPVHLKFRTWHMYIFKKIDCTWFGCY